MKTVCGWAHQPELAKECGISTEFHYCKSNAHYYKKGGVLISPMFPKYIGADKKTSLIPVFDPDAPSWRRALPNS